MALAFAYIIAPDAIGRFRSGKYSGKITFGHCAAMFPSRNSEWKWGHAQACHPVEKHYFYQDM
jgi:hypothetical protein